MTIKADPLTNTLFEPEERTLEKIIRPYHLSEYIGQTRVCDQLKIFIGAAQARQEALDHILIFGPPGLGKCITADALLLTGEGWQEFHTLLPDSWAPDQYCACRHEVYGLQGLEKASHLYNGGSRPTIRIWTASGFGIEGTFNHRLLAPLQEYPSFCYLQKGLKQETSQQSPQYQWRTLPEFSLQDSVSLVKNMQLWRPHTLELSAIVQIQAQNKYQQFSALVKNTAHLRNFTLSNASLPSPFVDYTLQLSYLLGGLIAQYRHPHTRLPNWILRSSGKVILTCLSGLLAHCPRQSDSWSVTYQLGAELLSRQVQLLLLNLGIVSRRYLHRQNYQLQFHPSEWDKCQAQFNLILTQSPLNSPAPELFNDRITAITFSRSQVYDFCVPGSHAFLANGFYNHNTTLAQVTAHEMGVNLRSTSGPVLEKAGDLAALLTNLEPKDILFIDEIHRLSPGVAEILYPAMEDYQLDIMVGEGPAARSLKLSLPPFTLVGATTRAGLLTSPLRDRFGITQRLEFYTEEELAKIIHRTATILGVPIDSAGALEIARRSRGTPRIANRLLKRVRDYAQMWGSHTIEQQVAQQALKLLSIDQRGLDPLDHRFLTTLLQVFNGGPVGIDSLAAAIGEERGTLEDVVEPFLLQQGFLIRTARGRMATPLTWEHCQQTSQKDSHEIEALAGQPWNRGFSRSAME